MASTDAHIPSVVGLVYEAVLLRPIARHDGVDRNESAKVDDGEEKGKTKAHMNLTGGRRPRVEVCSDKKRT